MREAEVKALIASMLMELSENLESRRYCNMDREGGDRSVAASLEEIKDAVNSTIEEKHLW